MYFVKLLCNLCPLRIPEEANTTEETQQIRIPQKKNKTQERVERIGIGVFDMVKMAVSPLAFLIGASHVSEYLQPQHEKITPHERIELIVGQYGASLIFGGTALYEMIRYRNDTVARRQLSTCSLVTRIFNITLLSGSAISLSICAYLNTLSR